MIVIEHDLELVTNCDYIIDMGPWGGTEGGRVVVEGTPEQWLQILKALRVDI